MSKDSYMGDIKYALDSLLSSPIAQGSPGGHGVTQKTLVRMNSTWLIAIVLVLVLCFSRAEQDCNTSKDGFGYDDCIKDRYTLELGASTLQISDAYQVNFNLYLISTDEAKATTLFTRYEGNTFSLDWAFKETKYFETLAVTPDEQILIVAVDGEGANQNLLIHTYQPTSTELKPLKMINGYNSEFPMSRPHMEVYNNTAVYLYANTITTGIDLIRLDVATGTADKRISFTSNAYIFGQVIVGSSKHNVLIMYQVIASRDIRFGGVNVNDNTVFQNSGINCPTSGDTSCVLDTASSKAVNDDGTIAYIVSSFKPTGMFFLSLKFDALNVINGNTFITSVEVTSNYHLTYNGGFVYLIFETQVGKSVFTKYNPSSDSFTDEIYESDIKYRLSFAANSRIGHAGVSEQNLMFRSCFNGKPSFSNHY
ncbi:unnamed protein product [Moneuplotes crassus]|uniref:Uncharacterized protein n=1 Tax=Euplotes crassus TaxID=5936 RepID=A0AAD1Y7W8_EUPCR|nr:unnamed protein product [Moneuplotes crassus]